MRTLKEAYVASGAKKELPDNKEIAQKFAKIAELKKYMKKVMPFAESRKQMFLQQGPQVFEQTSLFDEVAVLQENIAYLTNALELEGLDVKFSDEADLAQVVEECCPLEPTIVFRREESASLRIINNQPYNGLFESEVDVFDGDTGAKLIDRIKREIKNVKGKTCHM